jgi:hypothetical protein
MKLKYLSIDFTNQTVTCQCALVVQDNAVLVPFTVPESALYEAASARGADTWENEDVCLVGSAIVGQPITL